MLRQSAGWGKNWFLSFRPLPRKIESMSKLQFWTLNSLAAALVLLLALKIALALDNGARQSAIAQGQVVIAQAQRTEPIMREIALRLAQASVREPQLADLLKQHGIRVTPSQPQIANP